MAYHTSNDNINDYTWTEKSIITIFGFVSIPNFLFGNIALSAALFSVQSLRAKYWFIASYVYYISYTDVAEECNLRVEGYILLFHKPAIVTHATPS